MEFYHVVTERPMYVGQKIIFDKEHHSGVYNRVMEKQAVVDDIYAYPEKYDVGQLDHHIKVALRELALEEVRQESYPDYPSRMSSLYVSKTLEEAEKWFAFFTEIGRPTYQIVKVRVRGRSFAGNANRCFDGTTDRQANLMMARAYWENDANRDASEEPVMEILADGEIEVVEIIRK